MATEKAIDTTGISNNAATQIRTAIDDYVKACGSAKLKIEATTAKIKAAIKGSNSEAAVANYANTATAYIESLLQSLKRFQSELDQKAANYASYDSSNTTVSNLAKEMSSKS